MSRDIARHLKGRAAAAVEARLADAATAFERDRIPEAQRILAPLARDHPDLAPVRELAGLASYRSGRWSEAARHLEAHRAITGSPDLLPVLADCCRALKRYRKVDELWAELRSASPAPAILAEGRIVAAGSLADRGQMAAAVALLEPAAAKRRRGRAAPDWEVRTWYALADLYERSGDMARARDLFTRVVAAQPDLADAAERLASLA